MRSLPLALSLSLFLDRTARARVCERLAVFIVVVPCVGPSSGSRLGVAALPAGELDAPRVQGGREQRLERGTRRRSSEVLEGQGRLQVSVSDDLSLGR